MLFPFIVLAFLDPSSLRIHFGPFTEVLRKIWRFVTQKNANHGSRGWHGSENDSRGKMLLTAQRKQTSCAVNVRVRNATFAKERESPRLKNGKTISRP